MNFKLRDEIYYCVSGGQSIFLDLKADRYFTTTRDSTQALVRSIRQSHITDDDRLALQPLFDQGVFIDAEAFGLPASGPSQAAVSSLNMKDLPPPKGPLMATAIWHQIRTQAQLKGSGLFAMIKHLQGKKSARGTLAATGAEIEPLVSSFLATRSLFTVQDKCLRESIAMVRYMVAKGRDASLILGVTSRPFAAHAWVESGGIILNDTRERVGPYTPIMRV